MNGTEKVDPAEPLRAGVNVSEIRLFNSCNAIKTEEPTDIMRSKAKARKLTNTDADSTSQAEDDGSYDSESGASTTSSRPASPSSPGNKHYNNNHHHVHHAQQPHLLPGKSLTSSPPPPPLLPVPLQCPSQPLLPLGHHYQQHQHHPSAIPMATQLSPPSSSSSSVMFIGERRFPVMREGSHGFSGMMTHMLHKDQMLLSKDKQNYHHHPHHGSQENHPRRSSISPSVSSSSSSSDHPSHSNPPVYIPEDVVLPSEFELRESCIQEAGLGVFSLVDILQGRKFGPFMGVERALVKETQYAWEIVDEFGKVKCWIDASEPGTGNWMKYVRSAPKLEHQNMVPVQVDGKVYYKAIHNIGAGEELLVLKDAAFPDQEGSPIQLIEEKQYGCEECHNTFRSKVALRRHQKYACNNANAIFSTLNQEFKVQAANAAMETKPSSDDGQREEMSEDSGERPPSEGEHGKGEEFCCSNCSRTFHWKSDLIKHQAMHCGDRMYPCENCGKCFSDPSNLHRHIRSQHEGARSHPCPECGKTFATSSGLKQHTHIHSSIKPFTCEVCLKSYTQFSNLCRHKRMHANCRTQLKCSTCGQTFSTVTSLNKHRRFCHNAQVFNSQLNTSINASHNVSSSGVLLRGNAPLLGMPPTSALYQAGLAQMWNANLQLSQQALMQNNLLSGSSNSNSVIRGPYPLGYPSLATHPSLLASSLSASALSSAAENANKNGKGMSTEEWLQHYTASSEKEGSTKESPRSIKVEKDDSEASEASVSTPSGSELDCSSYSDVESETEMDVAKAKRVSDYIKKEKPDRDSVHGSGKISPGIQGLGLPLMKNGSSEPIKAIASIADRYFSTNPGGYGLLSVDPAARLCRDQSPPSFKRIESPVKKGDNPFDISRKLLKPLSSEMRKVDDQPLDLSLPRPKKSTDHVLKGDDQPKRAPIFGIPTALLGKSGDIPASVAFSYPGAMPGSLDPIYRVQNGTGPPADKYQRLENGEKVPAVPVPLPHFPPLPKMDFYAANKNLMKFRGLPAHQAYALNSTMIYSGSSPSDKMVIRSKDRYTCKYCGKLFPRSANLTRHLRTHTGEQPYSCKYCDRSFSISSNLQRHVRNIHNKEKPFKCPLCDRCFGQQTNLDRHLKKHESEDFSGDSQTPEKVNGEDRPIPLRKLEDWSDELSEKDEAYFTEIKNFIGVAEMKARRDLQLKEQEEKMYVDRVKSSLCGTDKDAGEEEKDTEERDNQEEVAPVDRMKLKLKLPLRKEAVSMEVEMEKSAEGPKVAMEMDHYPPEEEEEEEGESSLPRTPDSVQDMQSEDAMSVSEYQEDEEKDDDASSTARPDSLGGDEEEGEVSRLNGHHPKLQAYSIMVALSEDERKKAVLAKGQPLMCATQHTATVI